MIKNIVIGIETLIIIILLVIVINNKNSTKTNSNDNTNNNNEINEKYKKILGNYFNEQYKKTIRIEDNNICMYHDEYDKCTYTLENDVIKIHMTYYMVEADNNQIFYEHYNSIEKCNEDLKTNELYKNASNPYCREQNYRSFDYDARIVDNGLLIDNKLLYKKIS